MNRNLRNEIVNQFQLLNEKNKIVFLRQILEVCDDDEVIESLKRIPASRRKHIAENLVGYQVVLSFQNQTPYKIELVIKNE